MSLRRVAIPLLVGLVVLVLVFPLIFRSAPVGWFEVYVLLTYAAIIAAVVWFVRWMIHLGSDVAGIRRALEERNALDAQARTVPRPVEDVPPSTPPTEPPDQ